MKRTVVSMMLVLAAISAQADEPEVVAEPVAVTEQVEPEKDCWSDPTCTTAPAKVFIGVTRAMNYAQVINPIYWLFRGIGLGMQPERDMLQNPKPIIPTDIK
jgi:hypothetical protein